MNGITNTHKLNVFSARNFINNIDLNSLYIAIGQSSSATALPTDKDTDSVAVFTGLYGAKKLKKKDACLAVPRIDWVTGTNYTGYSSGSSQSNFYSSSSFYCLADTTNYNVYKCMQSGSSASNVKPTTTTPGVIQTTTDGYQWLYLYTIPEYAVNKFLTVDYIPVPTVTTNPGTDADEYTQWLVQSNATGIPTYNGSDAGIELNANYVIVSSFIRFGEPPTAGGSDIISTSVSYYQSALLLNPMDAASSATAFLNAYGPSGLVVDRSKVLVIDNHSSFTRTSNTIDNIRLIMKF